jgi:hypothetical protein
MLKKRPGRLRKANSRLKRGGYQQLLALQKQREEVERAASVCQETSPAREYQTTHKDQIGDQVKGLEVAKSNKISSYRAWEAVAAQ